MSTLGDLVQFGIRYWTGIGHMGPKVCLGVKPMGGIRGMDRLENLDYIHTLAYG